MSIDSTPPRDDFRSLWEADVHRVAGASSRPALVAALRGERSFAALFLARLCQADAVDGRLGRWGGKLVRRLQRLASARAGIDLPWEATVGPGLRIVHGWGLVISPDATLGTNVTVFHGVTIGRKDDIDDESGERIVGPAPTIEDGVWLGPHAIVVGGIRIGAGARIGGGAVVTTDVPPRSLVVGNPARVVREDVAPDIPNPAPSRSG